MKAVLYLRWPDQEEDGIRRTFWELISRKQVLAVSMRCYRNRADALRGLERVTGGQVQYARETETSRPQPIALFRPNGEIIPIERVIL